MKSISRIVYLRDLPRENVQSNFPLVVLQAPLSDRAQHRPLQCPGHRLQLGRPKFDNRVRAELDS